MNAEVIVFLNSSEVKHLVTFCIRTFVPVHWKSQRSSVRCQHATRTCVSVDNVDLSSLQCLRVLLLRDSTVNLPKPGSQQCDKAHCLCAFRRGKRGPSVCLSAESRFCYQQVSVRHEAIGQLKEQWITIPQSRKHNWVSNIYIWCLAMERGFIKSCCVRLSRISNLLLILKPKLRMEPVSGHMQETSVKWNYLFHYFTVNYLHLEFLP